MGLPVVRTGNTNMDRFLEQVRLYIDAQNGDGPNKSNDRVLRVSDLDGIVKLAATAAKPPVPTASAIEKLAQDIANTRLFKSLTGRGGAIDDVVDGLPRQILADVRAVDGKGAASVTSEAIVSVEEGKVVAAKIETVEATLTGLEGDIASVEVAYLALASDVTGLEAQYTVKVTAGGAVAGFGLAATSPVGGTPSSAFIVSADKFAIVSPGYTGGLTNTPSAANIPFSVDADGVYINGRLNQTSTVSVAGASTFNINYGATVYAVQSPCHFQLNAASTGLAYSAMVASTTGVGAFQFGITGMATGTGTSVSIGVNGHATGGAASYGGAFYGSSADIILNGSGKIQWGGTLVNVPSGSVNDALRGNGTWGIPPLAQDSNTLQGANLGDIGLSITTYVQGQAACRGGSSFTLNVPSLGASYTGCTIS